MESRRIDTIQAFRALREPWNELVENGASREIFARHEWFDAWIRAYETDDRLDIETIWRDGLLVAIAPMQRVREHFRGIDARALHLLWSGVAPRGGVLVREAEDVEPLLESLTARRDWDVLVAPNLPDDAAATPRMLAWLKAHRIPHQAAPGFASPYLAIEGSWDAHWSGLPRERRRYFTKKCVNRLEREGGHQFARVETRPDLEAFLPEMYALSQKSWKAGISSELHPKAPVARLLVDFAREGLEQGWVRIDTLRVDGRLIAFEYMLVGPDRHSVVRSDYDLDYKYYTPGNSLRLRVVRDLFESGVAEYDLGGDPHPYKLDWCDRVRHHRTVTVANRTWRGRLILTAKNILLPAIRRLRGGASSDGAADTEAEREVEAS